MPIYEYKCSKCGSVFELLQKVIDPVLKTCSHCGGLTKKLFSAPALQFKGSGWYVTDYAQKEKGGKGSAVKPKPKNGNESKKESQPPVSAD